MVNSLNYWYQKYLAEKKKVVELEEQVKNAEDHAYFSGSEAMREKLIDKACEWLEDNLVQCWIEDFLYVQFKHHEHQEKENVLANFRKAMEE